MRSLLRVIGLLRDEEINQFRLKDLMCDGIHLILRFSGKVWMACLMLIDDNVLVGYFILPFMIWHLISTLIFHF